MFSYTVITTNGVAYPKRIENLSLEKAQQEVGGYVEAVCLADQVLLCDEDGLVKKLPVNNLASAIAGRTLVGTVVSLPRNRGWG